MIEILAVISIISLLSSVVFTSVSSARNKARYARSQADIYQLKNAMLMYKIDVGKLPPLGDLCSYCSNPPNATWTLAVDALANGVTYPVALIGIRGAITMRMTTMIATLWAPGVNVPL